MFGSCTLDRCMRPEERWGDVIHGDLEIKPQLMSMQGTVQDALEPYISVL